MNLLYILAAFFASHGYAMVPAIPDELAELSEDELLEHVKVHIHDFVWCASNSIPWHRTETNEGPTEFEIGPLSIETVAYIIVIRRCIKATLKRTRTNISKSRLYFMRSLDIIFFS